MLALLFSVPGYSRVRSSGEVKGFSLTDCGIKNCLTIVSDKGSTGFLSSSFAFASANIKITDKKTKAETILNSQDVFFDASTKKLFIRQMAEYKNKEAVYDLASEKLSLY